MNFSEIKELKDRVLEGYNITREESIRLSKTENIETLYYSANQLRARFCGYKFEMCSVINNVIGNCEENCTFCPLSSASKVDYGMYEIFELEKEIEHINEIHKKGVKKFEITTNHKTLTDNQLDLIIGQIQELERRTKCKICASLGTLSFKQLERLKNETSVSTYHCNIETSPQFYKNICTSIDQNEKFETIKNAHKLGFSVCSGIIIGLGENMEERIDMALKLRELEIKSIPINILYPFAGTPVEKMQKIGTQEILTTIAIIRFINPKATLRFARGRSLVKIIEKEAYRAGINSSFVGDVFAVASSSDIDEDKKNFEEEGFVL